MSRKKYMKNMSLLLLASTCTIVVKTNGANATTRRGSGGYTSSIATSFSRTTTGSTGVRGITKIKIANKDSGIHVSKLDVSGGINIPPNTTNRNVTKLSKDAHGIGSYVTRLTVPDGLSDPSRDTKPQRIVTKLTTGNQINDDMHTSRLNIPSGISSPTGGDNKPSRNVTKLTGAENGIIRRHKFGVDDVKDIDVSAIEGGVNPKKYYVQYTNGEGKKVTLVASNKLFGNILKGEVGREDLVNIKTGFTNNIVYLSKGKWHKGSDIINYNKRSTSQAKKDSVSETAVSASVTVTPVKSEETSSSKIISITDKKEVKIPGKVQIPSIFTGSKDDKKKDEIIPGKVQIPSIFTDSKDDKKKDEIVPGKVQIPSIFTDSKDDKKKDDKVIATLTTSTDQSTVGTQAGSSLYSSQSVGTQTDHTGDIPTLVENSRGSLEAVHTSDNQDNKKVISFLNINSSSGNSGAYISGGYIEEGRHNEVKISGSGFDKIIVNGDVGNIVTSVTANKGGNIVQGLIKSTN